MVGSERHREMENDQSSGCLMLLMVEESWIPAFMGMTG